MHSRRDFLSTALTAGVLTAGLAAPVAGVAREALAAVAAGPHGMAGVGAGAWKFFLVDGWILTAEDVAALGLE